MQQTIRSISPGKARGLARISDGEGRYAMLAIDQRTQLFELVSGTLKKPPEATGEDIGVIKGVLAEVLVPEITGLLVDPPYGYHHVVPTLPRALGLLLTLEDNRYETTSAGHRKTSLISKWSVAAAVRAGAEALKLLVYYRHDAPADVRAHQEALARQVGADCRAADRPFVLEILPYKVHGEDAQGYARSVPELTLRGAEAFADVSFEVDVYKLALPGDPQGVREWGGALYSLADLTEQMARITRLLPAPWVLLSGGMPGERFVEALRSALASGARGYLAGRAVWWAPLERAYPDLTSVRRNLRDEGLATLRALNAELARLAPQRPTADWRLGV